MAWIMESIARFMEQFDYIECDKLVDKMFLEFVLSEKNLSQDRRYQKGLVRSIKSMTGFILIENNNCAWTGRLQ